MKQTVVTKNEAGDGKDLQPLRESYLRYIAISKYLFSGEDPIYDINEMPKDNEFYPQATRIAKQLKISWKSMTHEESNRIMLALLEDCYNEMAKVMETKDLAVKIILKQLKHE